MTFNHTQRERMIIFLDKLIERKKIIKIEPITESKTLSQNNYIWLVFTHIANETGNTKEDIYQYYLKKYPIRKEIEINGLIDSIQVSLSKFTKEQTKVFIDQITTDARMEGFDIPDPEDLKINEMYNYYKEKGLI